MTDIPASDNALTAVMKKHLTASAKWARFLSVLGFAGAAFVLFNFISTMTMFAEVRPTGGGPADFITQGPGVALFVGYIAVAVIVFLPSLFLFKFASGILKSVPVMNVPGIEKALASLSSVFAFYSISILLLAVLYGMFAAIIGIH